MDVLFVTGFSPIVAGRLASREFYGDALRLPLDREEVEYVFTATLSGVKHFGLWPLSQAAQSCFGTDVWPTERLGVVADPGPRQLRSRAHPRQ
jgi:hypothetical protein